MSAGDLDGGPDSLAVIACATARGTTRHRRQMIGGRSSARSSPSFPPLSSVSRARAEAAAAAAVLAGQIGRWFYLAWPQRVARFVRP